MGNFFIHLLTSFCLYGSKEAKGCGCLILLVFFFIGSLVDAFSGSSTSGTSGVMAFLIFLFFGSAFLYGALNGKNETSTQVTPSTKYKPHKESNVLCLYKLKREHFTLYKECKLMDGKLSVTPNLKEHIGEFIITYARWVNKDGNPFVFFCDSNQMEKFYPENDRFNEIKDWAEQDNRIPAIIYIKDRNNGKYRIMKSDSWETYKIMMKQFCIIVDGTYK